MMRSHAAPSVLLLVAAAITSKACSRGAAPATGALSYNATAAGCTLQDFDDGKNHIVSALKRATTPGCRTELVWKFCALRRAELHPGLVNLRGPGAVRPDGLVTCVAARGEMANLPTPWAPPAPVADSDAEPDAATAKGESSKADDPSKGGGPARIAFMFVVFDPAKFQQLKRLFRSVYTERHRFLFHVNKGADVLLSMVHELVADLPNAHVGGFRFHNVWSGTGLYETYIAGLTELLSYDWDFFINLSESDHLIGSVGHLARVLGAMRGRTFLRSRPTATAPLTQHPVPLTQRSGPGSEPPIRRGYNQTMFIKKQILNHAFHQCDGHMFDVGPRLFPKGFAVVGGSDWYVLHRGFAEFVTDRGTAYMTSLRKLAGSSPAAAEMFFHTAAANSGWCDKVTWDSNLRIDGDHSICRKRSEVDWQLGCSPATYRMRDYGRLRHKMDANLVFWARKFDPRIDLAIMRRLDRHSGADAANTNPDFHFEVLMYAGHPVMGAMPDPSMHDSSGGEGWELDGLMQLAGAVRRSAARILHEYAATGSLQSDNAEKLLLHTLYATYTQPHDTVTSSVVGYTAVLRPPGPGFNSTDDSAGLRIFVGLPPTVTTGSLTGLLTIGTKWDLQEHTARLSFVHDGAPTVASFVQLSSAVTGLLETAPNDESSNKDESSPKGDPCAADFDGVLQGDGLVVCCARGAGNASHMTHHAPAAARAASPGDSSPSVGLAGRVTHPRRHHHVCGWAHSDRYLKDGALFVPLSCCIRVLRSQNRYCKHPDVLAPCILPPVVPGWPGFDAGKSKARLFMTLEYFHRGPDRRYTRRLHHHFRTSAGVSAGRVMFAGTQFSPPGQWRVVATVFRHGNRAAADKLGTLAREFVVFSGRDAVGDRDREHNGSAGDGGDGSAGAQAVTMFTTHQLCSPSPGLYRDGDRGAESIPRCDQSVGPLAL